MLQIHSVHVIFPVITYVASKYRTHLSRVSVVVARVGDDGSGADHVLCCVAGLPCAWRRKLQHIYSNDYQFVSQRLDTALDTPFLCYNRPTQLLLRRITPFHHWWLSCPFIDLASMPSIRGLNFVPARSYLFRLPLFTRAIVGIILAFWVLGAPGFWNIQQWGALIPSQVSFTTGTSRNLSLRISAVSPP